MLQQLWEKDVIKSSSISLSPCNRTYRNVLDDIGYWRNRVRAYFFGNSFVYFEDNSFEAIFGEKMREAATGPNFHRCWQVAEKIHIETSRGTGRNKHFQQSGHTHTHAKDKSIRNLQIEWVSVAPCWMPSYKTIRTESRLGVSNSPC